MAKILVTDDDATTRLMVSGVLKKAGFSTKEIAKALDMSVSAVDTTYARLLEKLRRLLGSGSDTRE